MCYRKLYPFLTYFLPGFTHDYMLDAASKAGNVPSPVALNFPLNLMGNVVPSLFTDFAHEQTSVLLVSDFGFGCYDMD